MKKVLVIAGVLVIVGLLATATVVVAWGIARGPVTSLATESGAGKSVLGQGANSDAGGRRFGSSNLVLQESAGGRYTNAECEAHEWLILKGTVVEGTESGGDIVIRSEEGEQVTVGTGPQWLQSQDFTLLEGDEVTINGFWEDGEFKAGEIIRERDQASITLRDADGHPAWAGNGQRGSNGEKGLATGVGRGAKDSDDRDRGGSGNGDSRDLCEDDDCGNASDRSRGTGSGRGASGTRGRG